MWCIQANYEKAIHFYDCHNVILSLFVASGKYLIISWSKNYILSQLYYIDRIYDECSCANVANFCPITLNFFCRNLYSRKLYAVLRNLSIKCIIFGDGSRFVDTANEEEKCFISYVERTQKIVFVSSSKYLSITIWWITLKSFRFINCYGEAISETVFYGIDFLASDPKRIVWSKTKISLTKWVKTKCSHNFNGPMIGIPRIRIKRNKINILIAT